MTIKKIFNAPFENSLNLLDINAIKFQENEFNHKAKTLKIVKMLLIVFIVFIFYLGFKISQYIAISENSIQFIPSWIFYSSLLILGLSIIYSIKNKYGLLRIYMERLPATVLTFLLIIYVILIICQLFFNKISLYFILSLFIITIVFSYLLVVFQINYIYSKLYNTGFKRYKSINEFITKILILFIVVVIPIAVISKYVFLFFNIDLSSIIFFDNYKTILVFYMLSIGIMIMISGLVLFALPFLLLGYYKYKYTEEYRNFEGFSKEEWYGEK